MRHRLLSLVVGCLAALLAEGLVVAQTGPADRPTSNALAGVWKLDRAKTKDDQDTWRRRLDGLRASQPGPPSVSSADPFGLFTNRTAQANGNDWQLRSAMRDLLEVAEGLTFQIAPDSVTITDDLDRSLKFATNGSKDKRQLAATEFVARTKWAGPALTQEITVGELLLTVVYLPSEDGRDMLVSIIVDKPTFQPPLKHIMRVYSRAN